MARILENLIIPLDEQEEEDLQQDLRDYDSVLFDSELGDTFEIDTPEPGDEFELRDEYGTIAFLLFVRVCNDGSWEFVESDKEIY